MLSFVSRYLKPEIKITHSNELREGPAIVTGTSRAAESLLTTPFRSVRCIAYSYKGYVSVDSRKGAVPSLIREETAYTTFMLDLPGGETVTAIPQKPGSGMSADEHRTMQFNRGNEFVAVEEAIRPGKKVQVEGMVVRRNGQWEIKYKLLTDLGGADGADSTARRKK
ncbi:MAG: hypothetical protein HUU55_08385 [Myxococcales bacterium]|nr:hypothetical protein [Myxococcales bacterium]